MPGREACRRLWIGRRRGCRGDGRVCGVPGGAGAARWFPPSSGPRPGLWWGGPRAPPAGLPLRARRLRLRLRPLDLAASSRAQLRAGCTMGCGNSTATNAGAGRETMEGFMLVCHLKPSIWYPIKQKPYEKIRRKQYRDSIIKSLPFKIQKEFLSTEHCDVCRHLQGNSKKLPALLLTSLTPNS
ncbi:overexpressed in colon carcinoma 1 protein isoform X2 [Erinaceus europaeus]|uniref:Overexpressed in colon carcinoma 1 protein isoform X2 n=1 Tax=Erinaceus europaeus TaxID=9365 RepID=A0ABM3XND0_ERIEU|nr:overexpressed in colon carcinoma 1 protein isoform X2 [Erinaceus europaeus]